MPLRVVNFGGVDTRTNALPKGRAFQFVKERQFSKHEGRGFSGIGVKIGQHEVKNGAFQLYLLRTYHRQDRF